jgi:DNA polymerase III subunit beta
MRFTVQRDALAEAVTWVARALPSRPVVPVLAGLLLRAEREDQSQPGSNGPGWLTASCFDYEVSARMRVRAEVAEQGVFLVPGRLLVEIVRSLPAHPVEFGDDPDGISVTCGEVSFAVASLPSAEYPELPELPQLAGTADGGVLATAIGQVTPAASRDDTLPMLTAVNVELDGATMTLAATDRYRLAVRELGWDPAPGFGDAGRVSLLVPARTLSDAAKMMSAGTEVAIMLRPGGDRAGVGSGGGGGAGAAEAMIGFDAGERRLTARLLAGEFVRYRSRFPEQFGCTADLPAEAFAEAVRRVALVAERGTPVQLTFAPGRVTVGAATQGQARARETVPADFAGDEPMIAFSPHYLLDGVIAATATAPATPAAAPATPATAPATPATAPATPAAAGVVPLGEPPAGPAERGPVGAGVRLWFTSPSKPAVITRQPDQDAAGARAAEGAFRYLVVPQRVQLSARLRAQGRSVRRLPAGRDHRADRRSAMPGEQQGGEQPDQHGQDQQREGGELARPVGGRRSVLRIAVAIARARPLLPAGLESGPGRTHGRAAHPRVPVARPAVAGRGGRHPWPGGHSRRRGLAGEPGEPGQPSRPGQIGHDPRELTERLRREHRLEALVQFLDGQPPSREVLAEIRRRRVAFRVPDAHHMRTSWPERVAATREGSVITHRHRPFRVRSEVRSPPR